MILVRFKLCYTNDKHLILSGTLLTGLGELHFIHLFITVIMLCCHIGAQWNDQKYYDCNTDFNDFEVFIKKIATDLLVK